MTQDLTPEAVAAKLEGVTPGPWEMRSFWYNGIGGYEFLSHQTGRQELNHVFGCVFTAADDRSEPTARFIAWAREAVPALAADRDEWKARAEAAEAKLAEVEAERDEATNQLDSARHSVDVLEKRAAEVEAEKREMVMQSLADLGQAQEAYEAQLAAEAEVARLRGALTGIKRASKARMASYGDEHSYYYVTAIAALQPKETDHE
jgi:hypothetical protein